VTAAESNESNETSAHPPPASKRARPDPSPDVQTISSEKVFNTLEIITAAQNREIERLHKLAASAAKQVLHMKAPSSKGWRAHLPYWVRRKKKVCVMTYLNDISHDIS